MAEQHLPFHVTSEGIKLHLKVTPQASVNKIADVGIDGQGAAFLRVYVTAVADGGKANSALLKLLSKSWKIPKSSVKIVRGKNQRFKVIEIIGDPDDLYRKLTQYF